MGAKSVNGDLPTGGEAVALLLTPEQSKHPELDGNYSTTHSPIGRPDASLLTQRFSKEKLHTLRLRSEVGLAFPNRQQGIPRQHYEREHRMRTGGIECFNRGEKLGHADHDMQASRNMQRLLPKAGLESDSKQAGGHTFELDNNTEDLVSEEDFRIKTALSMPTALQGASDAAGREMRSTDAERSMHSSNSLGMPPLVSSFMSPLFRPHLTTEAASYSMSHRVCCRPKGMWSLQEAESMHPDRMALIASDSLKTQCTQWRAF